MLDLEKVVDFLLAGWAVAAAVAVVVAENRAQRKVYERTRRVTTALDEIRRVALLAMEGGDCNCDCDRECDCNCGVRRRSVSMGG